jgi:transcriptional regulator with XRE-family HTH domain
MSTFVARPNLALALALDDRSFEEIATAAGTTVAHLSDLVRGTTLPDDDERERLAGVLLADPEDLFLPHETIRRLNGGQRLDDPEVGARLARFVRDLPSR